MVSDRIQLPGYSSSDEIVSTLLLLLCLIDMWGMICIASPTQPNQTMLWSSRWPDTPRQSPPSSSAQMESGLPAPVSSPHSHPALITTPHHVSSSWQPCITCHLHGNPASHVISMTTLHLMSSPWQLSTTCHLHDNSASYVISMTTLYLMLSPSLCHYHMICFIFNV